MVTSRALSRMTHGAPSADSGLSFGTPRSSTCRTARVSSLPPNGRSLLPGRPYFPTSYAANVPFTTTYTRALPSSPTNSIVGGS